MKLLFILLLISSTPEAARIKYHKAIRTENPLEAIEYYRQIINDAPKTSYADSSLFRIGMFYYLIGDYDQTISSLEIIYNKGLKSSLYRKACYWLEISWENLGDTTKALEFAKIVENLKETKSIKTDTLLKSEKTTVSNQAALYTVQLGAYRDREWADLFLERLKEHNLESYVIVKGEYIRICSGNFSTRAEAESWLIELNNSGFDGWIIKVKP